MQFAPKPDLKIGKKTIIDNMRFASLDANKRRRLAGYRYMNTPRAAHGTQDVAKSKCEDAWQDFDFDYSCNTIHSIRADSLGRPSLLLPHHHALDYSHTPSPSPYRKHQAPGEKRKRKKNGNPTRLRSIFEAETKHSPACQTASFWPSMPTWDELKQHVGL
ncbi:predicted protein [Plenodomus lingam JN3]|uniref:Predicted protein n=1 Tax=Leptosphaeria maculans (strain JN3 / isolate v23.1.3 / race Av1-4-5-6-7-8) TaxID=985895 RepID=E5ABZ9_LEPMJ|nr:predicted protein [Plenodomus lingam JN3]CBY01190.1 predicted protein [Plenodomus lingam JN3]